jgi:hypothetical protein
MQSCIAIKDEREFSSSYQMFLVLVLNWWTGRFDMVIMEIQRLRNQSHNLMLCSDD